MRVLVTWGSKRGGTEEIGRILGAELETRGHDVVTATAEEVDAVKGFDAAIVGGALYANRWPVNVRRFVKRNTAELRKLPVWFFSSGPLDDSAERGDIPATSQVGVLAERVGARAHVTFGGRLEPDAEGFPASAMAKTMSGDWRNPERIRAWAGEVADELPGAGPGTPVDHPARSVVRLLAHALVGWLLCALTLGGLPALVSTTVARVIHAVAAPLFFAYVARHYFGARGARDPLPTAFAFTAVLMLLDAVVVAGLILGSFAIFASLLATWLPYALVFAATWATGALMSTMPWSTNSPPDPETTPPETPDPD